MCKSLELIEMMAETVTEMHLHIKELRERQNDVNLMRSDIQHQLENEEVTPTNAYNLAKAYHLLNKERREVTDEIELLQDAINKVSEGFGHIGYYYENKVRECEYRKNRREKGSEVYSSRKLDLEGNVLQQVKDYLG